MGNNLNNIYLKTNNIISSLGFTTQENIDGIYENRSGITLNHGAEISDSPIPAGTIHAEKLRSLVCESGLEEYTKAEQLIILSVKDILSQTQIDLGSSECGMILSTTKGNVELLKNNTEVVDSRAFLGNMASTIARYFDLGDRVSVISNACISGVSALIVARRLLQSGTYRHIIVVGVDVLSHFITSGFLSFKSISESICSPYDKDRDGLSLGEACGSILLTTEHSDNAIVLRGGAITNDANHISGPSRTGDGLFYAIQGAMDQANISANAIDFVNLHGTATVFNDEMEAKAIHLAHLQNIPVNSLKPYFGHTLGASGVIETIVCMHELKNGIVFGTPNYKECGVSLPLNIDANHSYIPSINICIKTASGFGGCNAAIVLSCIADTKEDVYNANPSEFKEVKKCVISDSSIKLNEEIVFLSKEEDFPVFIREAFKNLNESNQKFYKMDDLCKLGYIAAAYLLNGQSFEPTEIGIVLSNASSSLDTDIRYQKIIDAHGDGAASPAIFVYTLPNIVAGEICIHHKIQGENTFFVDNTYKEDKLLEYTKIAMAKGNLHLCIYGWCELIDNKYKAEFRLLEKTKIWKN